MAAAKVKSAALSVSYKCRNILAAGWEAHLNTIKADAKGSKGEIYTSRVHYMIQKGTPYLIVPENDMHNINIAIDERGSLAVCSPIRGRVVSLLKSLKKNAVMLSIDHHGFDVLAKVPERATLAHVPRQYHWKEFRFTFKEPAKDAGDFCRALVELEEEILQSVKRRSIL